MKRLLSIFLTLILCVTCALSLTACNDNENKHPYCELFKNYEHSFTENVVPPTCTESGFAVYTCNCGYSYSQIIDATGHYYKDYVVPPTCLKPGYTDHICDCGEKIQATNPVAPKGHDWKDGKCSVCGKEQNEKD